MISRLVTEYIATGQLNRETAAINGVIMMQAGHETTANMISLGTVALLQTPRCVRAARPDRRWATVVANIVEELMRYLTIVHAEVDRMATEDLTLGGQLIRAGDWVVMNLPAGNWDDRIRRQTRACLTRSEIRAGIWASATACTNASGRTWREWRCRSRSPRWRGDYLD